MLLKDLTAKIQGYFREEQMLKPVSFLAISAQLALVLLAIYIFRVGESQGLPYIAPLIFVGFCVHAWLPIRFRMPFFLLLSLTALGISIGYLPAAVLVGIGIILVAICHLPVRQIVRVVLLVLAGLVLAAIRAEWLPVSWNLLPTLVLPVLGAMFMFRLIIYLYDLPHEENPASIWERLSYFFMLPNIYFLLFPVVDYETFRRTYYDKPAAEIYQKGALWMFRGVLQLLIYRYIYYNVLPPIEAAADLSGVLLYMGSTYLLYLRISGQFHLIIGMMCLFGYNLPETHHLYLLASSFNDYWRRINIYWKDFMMKLFYYPAFMRLRRWGIETAMVISIIIVFLGTWLLHSYQWFWLRGTIPLNATDALFWGILGLVVIINSLYEAKTGRKVSLKKPRWSFQRTFIHSAKVVGMLLFITALWTLWSVGSLAEYLALISVVGNTSLIGWIVFVAVLLVSMLVGVLIQWLDSRGINLVLVGLSPSYRASMVFTTIGVSALLLLKVPDFQRVLNDQSIEVIASFSKVGLNQSDENMLRRGYYEGLLNTEKFTSALWELQAKDRKPLGWDRNNTSERVGGILRSQPKPSSSDPFYRGAGVSINRWGFRDKDYELEKPESTYRVIMLGTSHVFGAGVENHETFEARLENRLNDLGNSGRYRNFEILNFGMPSYSLPQQIMVCRNKIRKFNPDAIFYMAHPIEISWVIGRISLLMREDVNVSIELPGLASILNQAGVHVGMEDLEIRRLLNPHGEELVKWGYRGIVNEARINGIQPIWIFLPLTNPGRPGDYVEKERILSEWASEAGFTTISLLGVYDGWDLATLRIAPWDAHPNPFAHRLVAKRFSSELLKKSEELGWDIPSELSSVYSAMGES